ncbi:hypothetical protein, partial [Enterococcus faecium]|uniref:hypothetical protein n=2 Tax=Enterococcus faecium TaxID=1352 RepID=UPI001C5A9F35
SSFLLLSFSIILPYLIVDLKLCNRTLKKITDLSQIVNKLNNETYSKLVITHQEKTVPFHTKAKTNQSD